MTENEQGGHNCKEIFLQNRKIDTKKPYKKLNSFFNLSESFASHLSESRQNLLPLYFVHLFIRDLLN